MKLPTMLNLKHTGKGPFSVLYSVLSDFHQSGFLRDQLLANFHDGTSVFWGNYNACDAYPVAEL